MSPRVTISNADDAVTLWSAAVADRLGDGGDAHGRR